MGVAAVGSVNQKKGKKEEKRFFIKIIKIQ
jgi:hypothetical protein